MGNTDVKDQKVEVGKGQTLSKRVHGLRTSHLRGMQGKGLPHQRRPAHEPRLYETGPLPWFALFPAGNLESGAVGGKNHLTFSGFSPLNAP